MATFLITGNLGYIGPVLTQYLKKNNHNSFVIGYDSGFFANSILSSEVPCISPSVDIQVYGDIRDYARIKNIMAIFNVDHIVHLAAISNDPMGNEFGELTNSINYESSVYLGKLAIDTNVKSFVFASSCSVYGKGDDKPRVETDLVNPLTAYAKSKINTENDLKQYSQSSNSSTYVTCLRFSTATVSVLKSGLT